MKRSSICFCLAGILLILSACAPAPAPAPAPEPVDITESDIAAILRLAVDFIEAVNSDNVSGQIVMYTDDAIRLGPNQESLVGVDAIRSNLESFYAEYEQDISVEVQEVEVRGDLAFARGIYTFSATPKAESPPVEMQVGKSLVILKRQPDGSWRLYREIWNTDAPVSPVE